VLGHGADRVIDCLVETGQQPLEMFGSFGEVVAEVEVGLGLTAQLG
jgi:hypothetical protein